MNPILAYVSKNKKYFPHKCRKKKCERVCVYCGAEMVMNKNQPYNWIKKEQTD